MLIIFAYTKNYFEIILIIFTKGHCNFRFDWHLNIFGDVLEIFISKAKIYNIYWHDQKSQSNQEIKKVFFSIISFKI